MQSIGHKNSRTKTCVSKKKCLKKIDRNVCIIVCVCEREHVLTCV